MGSDEGQREPSPLGGGMCSAVCGSHTALRLMQVWRVRDVRACVHGRAVCASGRAHAPAQTRPPALPWQPPAAGSPVRASSCPWVLYFEGCVCAFATPFASARPTASQRGRPGLAPALPARAQSQDELQGAEMWVWGWGAGACAPTSQALHAHCHHPSRSRHAPPRCAHPPTHPQPSRRS